MTETESKIWNRACGFPEREGAVLREGDRALAALIKCHSLICNGGVFHVVDECFSSEELKEACVGYLYFGLKEAAEMLEEAQKAEWTEENENHFNDYYYDHFMKVIETRFSGHYKENPDLYAPV